MHLWNGTVPAKKWSSRGISGPAKAPVSRWRLLRLAVWETWRCRSSVSREVTIGFNSSILSGAYRSRARSPWCCRGAPKYFDAQWKCSPPAVSASAAICSPLSLIHCIASRSRHRQINNPKKKNNAEVVVWQCISIYAFINAIAPRNSIDKRCRFYMMTDGGGHISLRTRTRILQTPQKWAFDRLSLLGL